MPKILIRRMTLRRGQFMGKAGVRRGRRVAVTISIALLSLFAVLVLVVVFSTLRDIGT